MIALACRDELRLVVGKLGRWHGTCSYYICIACSIVALGGCVGLRFNMAHGSRFAVTRRSVREAEEA